MKQNNVSWNFWRQLCEKYSHTRLVWSALHHILREYGTYSANLHIQSKCGKNIAPEKGSEHGYYKLQYKPPNNENENRSKSTKNRKRNIIWFNPPFSKNVSNNIGKYFFLLIQKHFPNNLKYHKLFNKNNVKMKWYMASLKSVINIYKEVIMEKKTKAVRCNCINKPDCPLSNQCEIANIIYTAKITSNLRNYHEKIYHETNEGTFKQRYGKHKKSVNHEKRRANTELSKEYWRLKELKAKPHVKFYILKRCRPTKRTSIYHVWTRNYLSLNTKETTFKAWRQLCEKYSHTGLVWPALHHILPEYEAYSINLHIQSKCGKNIAPEKGSEHGHYKLQYKPPNNENENRSKSTKNRKRNIIWFNPPFSKNVSNNIGKYFFLLIQKHFPNNLKYHKLFNKNNVKMKWYMASLKSVINIYKEVIMEKKTKAVRCNCINKPDCPLSNQCEIANIIYTAKITSNLRNYHEKIYHETNEGTFKQRYGKHKKSVNHEKRRANTELSKEYWRLKELKAKPHVKFYILKRCRPTKRTSIYHVWTRNYLLLNTKETTF